jgi:hypothetical protein
MRKFNRVRAANAKQIFPVTRRRPQGADAVPDFYALNFAHKRL